MTGKKSDLGPSGINLTHRVRELRGKLSYAELSRRLADMGRDIPPLGLRRIESGARRVDVDDLVALSLALGVSPVTLLMPDSADADSEVDVTGLGRPCQAEHWWSWLTAAQPLPEMGMTLLTFGANAWPQWWHRRVQRQGLAELLHKLGHGVDTDGHD